ncbi:MAG: LuxR C-terminal-related transcriptional regulator [Thermomicrobiales bacterium]
MTFTGTGLAPIQIKTQGPALPRDLIERERLLGLAASFAMPGVTLVVAPAGFGKTTLVSGWAERSPIPAAWLGLDGNDRDPDLFTRNLVAAIRRIVPGFGESTLSRLRSGFDAVAIAQRIADDLLEFGPPLLLVLDDYHEAASPEVNALLGNLLRWQPPGLHLVIDSRVTPDIALSRLRALGLVADIGPDDLRFSREETADFLHRNAEASLPDEISERTWQLTEGWPVALRLYALAMPDHPDPRLPALSSQRPVRDYLIDEVLNTQPGAERDHLLRIALPDRIDIALCQRLCGLEYPDAAALLDRLTWTTRLLTPLEDGSCRFHGLIRDTFRERLLAAHGPEAVADLHRDIAGHLEARGDVLGAITHLRAAGDDEGAARTIHRFFWRALDLDRRPDIERWLRAIPDALIAADPALMFARAVGLSFRGNEQGSETCLDDAEALLATGAGPTSEGERARIAAAIDVLHAENFRWSEDHEEQIRRMDQDLAILGEGLTQTHIDALSWKVLALYALGRADEAIAAIDAVSRPDTGSPDAMTARLAMIRAGVLLFAMRPDQAAIAARRAIRHADPIPLESIRAEARALLGLAHLYRLELDIAEPDLREAMAHRSQSSIFFEHESTLGNALLLHLTGRGDEAVALVEQYLAQTADVQDIRWQAGARSFRARLAALRGDHAGARLWLGRFQELQTDVPWRLVEAPEVTAIHVGLAAGGAEGVEAALEKLPAIIAYLDGDQDPANAIRARLLLALALQSAHKAKAAAAPIREAVARAAPGGVLLLFAEVMQPLGKMLRASGREGIAIADAVAAALAGDDAAGAFAGDRLSRREQQVMACLANSLTNKEIGEHLSISPATVKRHTIEIYRKLGVVGRMRAVEVARARGLL